LHNLPNSPTAAVAGRFPIPLPSQDDGQGDRCGDVRSKAVAVDKDRQVNAALELKKLDFISGWSVDGDIAKLESGSTVAVYEDCSGHA
jgi:hypothetical protein